MRKAFITVLSLALLVGTAPLALGSAGARKPTLRFAATAPVKVKGAQFKSAEKVRVTLWVNGVKRAKQARASSTGSFAVTFSAVEMADRCNSDVWARAIGARGSSADAKLPQPLCPPSLTPPGP